MSDFDRSHRRHDDDHAPRAPAPGKAPATLRIMRAARDSNGVAPEADAAVARASSSGGAPLPADVRERFEGSLGADLSAVRVHTGAASAEAASSVGARAYTIGNDIHFADGEYALDPFGIHLLAHEVAHTQQQAGGTPHRQHKLEVSSPGDAAEVDADRAADAMVLGNPVALAAAASPVALHRKLNEKDKAVWEAGKGDGHLAVMKAAASGWRAFRESPASQAKSKAIPGAANANALVELIGGAGNFKGHARAELGSEVLVAIGEMASFTLPGFVNLAAALGLPVTSAGHKVHLTKSAALTNSVPNMPIASVTITYSNALGWSWSRDFTITGVSVSASSKGWGVSAGVDVKVDADASPPLYRGYEDFSGATVAVMSGPKISTNWGGLNGKASTGGLIKMSANGLDTDFVVHMKASTGPAMPGSKAKPIDVSLGTGIGAAAATSDTTVTTPEIVKRVKSVSRPYGPFQLKKFETGKDEVNIDELTRVSKQLSSIKDELHAELDSQREEIKKLLGREPDPIKFRIRCEGYASRKWEAARDDNERRAKNDKLALDRAKAAKALLTIALGEGDDYEVAGHGAAVRAETPTYPSGGTPPVLPPVAENEDKNQVAQLEEMRKNRHDPVDSGPKGDDDEARAVWIYVSWSGQKLEGGYGGVDTHTVAMAPGSPGDLPASATHRGNDGMEGHDQGKAGPQAGEGGMSGTGG